MRNTTIVLAVILAVLLACDGQSRVESETWQQLFNGRDLDAWTPKFSGLPVGDNYRETFRVEDGMLTVSYENWDSLEGHFGHLFYNESFSHYKLRAEYRYIGDQVTGGPSWAFANNGLMLHCQPPNTMSLNQDFPLSLEFQLLAQKEEGVSRPCGNLCTPGSQVFIDGKLRTDHCLSDFDGPSFLLDEWVTAEAIVYGDSLIHHVLNGDTVLTYTNPIVAGTLEGLDTIMYKSGLSLGHGQISIQAESHGIQFRKIELLKMPKTEG